MTGLRFLLSIRGSIPLLALLSAVSSAEYYSDYNSADSTLSRTSKRPFEQYFFNSDKSAPKQVNNIPEPEKEIDILEEAEKRFEQDLCARVSEALSALAQSANRSHSELGLKVPLEPLYGAAPLKYVHEGDLLTLRLLLDNITLTGFNSMTVQEVKFVFDPLKRRFEQSNMKDYSSDQFISINSKPVQHSIPSPFPPNHSKNDGKQQSLQQVSIKDYYDDYDPILYQYNDFGKGKENKEDLKAGTEYHHSQEESPQKAKAESPEKKKDTYYVDSFYYDYQYDSPVTSYYDRQGRQRRSEHGLSLSPVISELLHAGEKRGNASISDSVENKNSSKHHCGKHCSYKHKNNSNHRHRIPSSDVHRAKGSSKHSRKKSRKSHHSSALSPGTYSPFSRYKRSVIDSTNSTKELPARSLEGVIRVAFTGLRMTSTYLIRGSAGDVFKFREQGTFELSSPAVYLVSRLRMVLPTGQSRHTRRSSHSHVQRVETEESISPPQLTLTPDTTPPRWVGSQVKLKLEELAAGIRRHRDGAVRHLIRQWERLLRRLVAHVTPRPDLVLSGAL